MPEPEHELCPVVVIMGVAGSGKTTLARALAAHLGWTFIEGDDFHSAANSAKMAAGQPLDNSDRRDWISALTKFIRTRREPCIVSCSALNAVVRGWIADGLGHAPAYILLDGPAALLQERLTARRGHFFDPALLGSQSATLEPPDEAHRIDISLPTQEQLRLAIAALAAVS
ncbi:gluconokinase [Hyphomonas johnsonii]|uniref:Gluconokinase n=1 Tax=Hyphomonas johnsonii MHS-2 TaxID=1280950 RepID=A0A059FTX4_9PROT|nr:gluconokinase [Hyphomonas johnsonii]KCZ94114.1 thermoresistant glucokinase family carbohydrate kinase [Hyphomonas johnsonii MHS-2]